LGAGCRSGETICRHFYHHCARDCDAARWQRRRLCVCGRAISDVNGQPVGAMVFWVTGLLSSFLDNAPTYLVFFNTLGGNAQTLMNEGATALAALSAGAV